MKRTEGSVRCDICGTYILQTVVQGAISRPSPLERVEVWRCCCSQVWPLFLGGLVTFGERIGEGEANFEQTFHPLFAEAGTRLMPSSLLGRRPGQPGDS
jgi:hypothetical protein